MGKDDIVLTREGLEKAKAEIEHLKSVHRKEVADRIREAKQFGEYEENSEYEQAKVEQAFIEGRILELQRILQHAVIVDESQLDARVVAVGTTVRLRDFSSGEEIEYKIVGAIEADPAEHRISNQSPVGQALLEHEVGETVTVATPSGSTRYEILSVTV